MISVAVSASVVIFWLDISTVSCDVIGSTVWYPQRSFLISFGNNFVAVPYSFSVLLGTAAVAIFALAQHGSGSFE